MTGPSGSDPRATGAISSADLLRECGRKLTDAALWQTFQDRFHRQITAYVIRTIWMLHGKTDPDLICDLVQEVYLRILQNSGRNLAAFRGETDFSVFAFLGRTAMNVVSDYYRSQQADKRQSAEIISLEDARRDEQRSNSADDADLTALLSWIDVKRLIESDPDRRNAARNVLIFKLHYLEGFTAGEISQYPGFDLTDRSIEMILNNLRTQLRKKMGR
jgi:RNA polymerase sigma factor (sigma-70 family)